MAQNKLVEWINDTITEWRHYRDDNYLHRWKEYERMWRGVWAAEDVTRTSERSRIISPALQQAIENHAAEIEEAVFGQGDHLFDIEDDMQDNDPRDVEYLKNYIKQNNKKQKARKNIGDSILLGSIYGTGITEIVTKKVKQLTPATQEIPNIGAQAIGVEEKEAVVVSYKAINPQNFIIDPNASTIEDAMGVAVEEFVSAHIVAEKIKSGAYKKADISDDASPDKDIEPTSIDQDYSDDKVKLIRYHGLVPRQLLESEGEEDVVDLFNEEDSDLINEYGDMVEAIIVIGNDELLKAEANPYMMKDRPFVAFQDDSVPNKFWGRGVAEKGYNMQKAIDAQLRSHLDSLALTSVPMMAMDATRLPRGSKFEVRPGKSILTNGNPAEILMPFKFGSTDGSNIDIASQFENMLLQATGTVDTAAMQTQPAGSGEISIVLSSIIKKNKRTLVNFQEQYLIPLIEKTAWRFMQFDPENFPVKDYNFVVNGSLGMLAREVEQLQLINLLKTLGDSPISAILIQGVVENSSLPNRTALLQQIQEANKPNPQQQQAAQLAQQVQMELVASQAADFKASAQKKTAEAQKALVDAQLAPEEIKTKRVAALTTNLNDNPAVDKEFEKRVKIADLMLKEKALNQKAKDAEQNIEVVKMQMEKKGTN